MFKEVMQRIAVHFMRVEVDKWIVVVKHGNMAQLDVLNGRLEEKR